MEPGAEFQSFSELEEAVRNYEESNLVNYYRRSSRSIEAYQKRLLKSEKRIERELKFAEIDYACKHGGKNFKSKGTGKRPGHSTFQQKCPSQIKIRVSKDGTKLVVREMFEQHNHHVSPFSYDHLSRQKRVYTEVKEEMSKMLQVKANKELIQEHVLQSTGTIVTLKDLHNAAAVKKPQQFDDNLVPLLEEMKKEPGSRTEIVVHDRSELQAIFYQDPRERELSPAEKLNIVEARRSRERLRQKTRINIGVAFPRWRSLMKLKGFRKDAEVACYLLDSYERASRRGKLQAAAVSCIAGTNRSDDDEDTDNSSDEEYYPPVCIGTSGELEKSPSVYRPVYECDAEILQVTVSNEEEQQEWNSSLGKEVPEPPHIQQEQEGEHLQVQMLNALAKHRRAVKAAFNPKVHLDITEGTIQHRSSLCLPLSLNVQQQLVVKEEVPPEQLEWDPGVEDKCPEPPHIKEELVEQWISQEGEQLQGQDEAGITKFPFTTVHVKSEHHEDEPQSSQCHQKQTDKGRVDCGSKPAGSLYSDTHLLIDTDDISKHSNEDTKNTEPALEQMETEEDGEGSQPDGNLVRVYRSLFVDSQYDH